MSEDRNAAVRVLLVDDDPLVRSALRMMLGADPHLEVVGEAADGAQAVDAVRSLRPDVTLMDLRMPVLDGIEATARITAMPPGPDGGRTQVIVLTTFDADDLVRAAIRAGASGFLLKHTPPERLLSAVHRVFAGEPMLSPSVTRQVMSLVAAADADPRRAAARAELEGLSERECQVALAIAEGKSNAEIAAELYLSVATIKSYVTHLLTRLNATNRVQIAIRVHDAGLL